MAVNARISWKKRRTVLITKLKKPPWASLARSRNAILDDLRYFLDSGRDLTMCERSEVRLECVAANKEGSRLGIK